MNFVGKFDGHLPSADAYARGSVYVESVTSNAPPSAITVDDGQLLFTGDFKRTGLDLVISKDDRELVLHDYFKGEKRAALASPDGAHLTGELVNALTGYTQYAQAGGAAEPAKVIGHVTKLTGSATAVRNGVAVVLNQGDNVNKGDVVQSGSDSTLGITFIDGTVFGLGPNAKMVLNEMIYDPNGSSNSSLMSLVSGTISFVAGATAKHGDMKVDTPVATMGIRGTAVLVEIDFDVQGSGGVPPAKFQVLVEPDGSTGSYILFDKTTLNPIATVDQAGTQTIVNGQGSVSFVSSAQLSTDAQKLISDVFALKFTDNNNPNTKLTTNFTDSVVPVTTSLKFATGDVILPTSFLLALTGNAGPQAPSAKPDHAPGAPHVVTQNASFTELAGLTHSALPDTVTGQITWTDVNLGDKPSAVVSFSTFSFHDASGKDVTSQLTAVEQAAIKAVEVPLLLESDPNNTNVGSATWTYSLADGAFDFLAAGETLTLTYVARVDNNYAPSNETAFKTFTITITGTNDTPVVTSAAQAGSITELPWTTNSAAPDTTHGTVTFTDADLTDTHTVTITGVTAEGYTGGLTNHATVLSWLSLGALTDSTDGVTGSRSWTFSAADKSFDYLAVGETLTLTYTIQINDQHGGVVTVPVTITIVGTDDMPVITSPTQAAAITEVPETTGSVNHDTASGTVTFTDVDLSDTHSVTVAGVTETGVTTGLPDQATILSWLSLGALSDSTGGVAGSNVWTFSAADKSFDYLAAGETLTLTYTIQVDDHHGGVVTQPVTITITGTNDVPTFTAEPQTTTIAEQPDTTGSSKPDVAQGVVGFADVDLSDTHTVSITGVTESGTTTGLPENESTILNWLSLGTLTDSTGHVTGSQAWTFSAADQNFDYLAAGETLTLTYTIQVDDHHGGVVSQPVTITVTGSNDVPTVTSEAQTATIAEQPDTTGSSKPDSASGTVTFTDVDLSDTHTMTITGVAEAGATAGLPEDQSTILNWLSLGTLTDSTGGLTGSQAWTFSAADQNFDYLALGETLTLTYTIQLDDHHGGVANTPVTITIHGANDAPTLADVNAGTLTDTAAYDTFSPLTGTLHGHDVDDGETATLTYAALNSDHAAVTQISGLYGLLTVNPDGTYSYVPDAAAINALAKGTYADTFTVETIDAHGAVGTATLTVDVIGANDTPTLAFHPTYLNFDGSTTAVGAVATTHVGNGSDGVTLAGWVDWNGNGNAGDSQLLFYNGSTSDAGLGVNGVVTADGLLDLQIQNGGIAGIDTGITIARGAWHHIALTHVNGDLTLYVDGTAEFTTHANVNSVPGSHTDFTLIGGVSSENGSSFAAEGFTGAIADVSVWNSALTPSQIQALESTMLSGNESGLAAYFPLNDGSGTNAADLVGSAGNLTVHGNPAWVVNGDASWPATGLSTAAGTALSITGLNVSDVDAGSTEQVTLNVGHGALALANAAGVVVSANGADGTLTFNGTVAAVDAALAGGVVYTPSSGYHGADSLHVSATDQGALTATMDLAINVTPTSPLEIHTDNLVVTGNGSGGETISGLTVTDAGAGADETFTLTAQTAGSGSSTVTPLSAGGYLTQVNGVLASGLSYSDGGEPLATDVVTVSVADAQGASDTVNLIFNVQQNPTAPVTLTSTVGKDVLFGTAGYQDQFVFAPNFNHDTILNFKPGLDHIDLTAVVSTSSVDTWISQHVAQSPTNAADTLITIDSADTITLRNISPAALGHNDFLLHVT